MTDSKLPQQNNLKKEDGNYEPIESSDIQAHAFSMSQDSSYNIQKIFPDNVISEQQLVLVLTGSVHEINQVRQRIIETHLQKISEDKTLVISSIQEGSIKIKAMPLSLKKLQELFESGKLIEILGIPIEYIYYFDQKQEDEKSNLIKDILENGAFGKDLTSTDFKEANLAGADLSGCDLSGSDLSGANLEGANLLYVNLSHTIIDSKTKLDRKWLLVWKIANQQVQKRRLMNADLAYTYLINADLSDANLSDANLSDANLEGANLEGANLEGANLTDANLESAELDSANLNNAILTNADLNYADLSHTDFKRADLSNADLSNANLSNANLNGANLESANMIRANFSDAKLQGSNLNKAYFSGANLIRADLRRANLSNAHLDAAYLISADLRHANLSNAYLDGANFKGANVENTRFANNPGISEQMKDDLICRGAIFS